MLRSRLAQVVIASAMLALSSCGGQREERVVLSERAQGIQGGALDAERTSVVGIFIDGSTFYGVCSGTLIAQNLVLTARHCVSAILGGEFVLCGQAPLGTPFDGGRIAVTTDVQISDQGAWYRGSRVLVAPGGNDTCGFDMAMLILAESVPSAVTIPYVPRIDLPVQADEPYTAVGYGETGTTGSAGTRMERSGLNVSCAVGFCGSSAIESTEFEGDTGICSGDSGGPALDVDNRVIGVVSRSSEACGYPVYGAVSAWRDWIRQGAMTAAQVGGYEPPRWAVTGSTVSTPSPLPSEPVSGGQGAACSETQSCADGLLCVYETTPSDAFCSARCDASAPCASGFTCSAELGACMPQPRVARRDDGCSVSPIARSPVTPADWLAALAVVGCCALRRRRPRHSAERRPLPADG